MKLRTASRDSAQGTHIDSGDPRCDARRYEANSAGRVMARTEVNHYTQIVNSG